MRDPEEEVRRQLDSVVGERYSPPRRWKATLGKWLAFAVLAVGASALVVGILDRHVMKAQTAPAPKKPVQVHIVPSR